MEMFDYLATKSSMFFVRNAAFFTSLMALSAVMTRICRCHIRILDRSSGRSLHAGAIPRSGGIAIVATFCVGILIYYLLRNNYFIGQSAFWGLFISAMIIATVSFYDDITNRSFAYKLLSQLLGVAIIMGFGLTLNEWSLPYIGKVSFGLFRYILTVFWIVGITNAFNFMDGINGLAGGVAVIASMSFAFIAYNLGSGVTFHISYIIAASCLGFLLYNFPRASIFMGDVGSAFLGFCFGAMAILSAHYDQYHTSFMVIPILLSNFILETLYTFVWRLVTRQSVLRAHKLHPYQLLVQMGVSAKKVTLIYYAQSIVLAFLCYVFVYAPIPTRIVLLLLILVSYTIYFLGVHCAARQRGLIKVYG